jgi:transposase-like protein
MTPLLIDTSCPHCKHFILSYEVSGGIVNGTKSAHVKCPHCEKSFYVEIRITAVMVAK